MTTSNATAVYFREDQRFRSPWLIMLIGSGTVFALASGLFLLIGQVWLGHSMGSRPLSNPAALVVGLIEVGVGSVIWWLFWRSVLQVEVTPRGLFVRYRPFHRKTRQIDLCGVVRIAAVTYRPLRDYGGWGFRVGTRWRCYNVSGEEGVRLDYADGIHLLIGSQRAPELESALRRIWQPAMPNDEPQGNETP